MGNKLLVNKNFFQEWSPAMAYVLGFWFADGSVERSIAIRGHYVRVGSTELEIISYIKRQLSAEHKIHKTLRPAQKNYYLLRIGDKHMFDELVALGVVERKSRTALFPKVPKKFLSHFIRGYFDGDGCVYLEKSKDGSYKRLTTVFTSGSINFLTQLRIVLAREIHTPFTKKISTTRSGAGATAFQLRYSSRDSLKLYSFLYKNVNDAFYLKRKHASFKTFMRAKDIENTLSVQY